MSPFRSADKTPAKKAKEILEELRNHKDERQKLDRAKKIFDYFNGVLKENQPEYVKEVISCLWNETSLTKPKVNDELDEYRNLIIVLAIQVDSSESENVATTSGSTDGPVRWNKLKKIFESTTDIHTIKLAARATSYLIHNSKSESKIAADSAQSAFAEFMDSAKEKSEGRSLAGVILARELALTIPSSFMNRAPQFFSKIFRLIKYTNQLVREASAQALSAAFLVAAQRESKEDNKGEWFKTAFQEAINRDGVGKDDGIHGMLLIFNELLRIANDKAEKARCDVLGINPTQKQLTGNPIDWLIESNVQVGVESSNARETVDHNFSAIVQKCLDTRMAKNSYCTQVLLEILPRLASFPKIMNEDQAKKRTSNRIEMAQIALAHISSGKPGPLNSEALISLGLIIDGSPNELESKAIDAVAKIRSQMAYALQKKRKADPNLFNCLALICRSQKTVVEKMIKELLPLLFNTGLSKGLTKVMHEVCNGMPNLKPDVLDGILDQLSVLLMNRHVPDKLAPPKDPPKPTLPLVVTNVSLTKLALKTLGEFDFQRHSLQMFMNYIAQGYLVCDSPDVRLSAVHCCAGVLEPFIRQYEKPDCPGREKVLCMIQTVLRSLVQVAVVDSEVAVRRTVLNCFAKADKIFHYHLAQAEMLDMVFMTLHDEKFEMQQEAVDLLGQLADLNPAYVYPRLRRVILETISKLKNSKKPKLEEHSALLIQKIAVQCPKFMRPYMSSVLASLTPHITGSQIHVGVQVRVLNALGELALVGGPDIVIEMKHVFPSLIKFLQDTSNLQKREAALRTMGRLSQNSGYVVDPYKDYPDLLDVLLKLLKNELSVSMRRQTVKMLGIMGALDPYTHKVFTGMVHSAKTKSFALSLPIEGKSVEDRQDIMQWITYEKCTLVQFYPFIAIDKLLGMLDDEALASKRETIVEALQRVFEDLRSDCAPFVDQVITKVIHLVQTCSPDKKEHFLQKLGGFVSLVGKYIKPYLRDIFKLMAASWQESNDPRIKEAVIKVLQKLGEALGTDFAPYIAELCPYLLLVVHSDETVNTKLVGCALECVHSIVPCLGPHVHLILPPVLSVVDDAMIPIDIRVKASDTLKTMVRKLMLAEHAPMIMQTWMRCIGVQLLQDKLMSLLCALVDQMQRQFLVFIPSVQMLLDKYGIQSRAEYQAAVDKINRAIPGQYLNGSGQQDVEPKDRFLRAEPKRPERQLKRTQIIDLCKPSVLSKLTSESSREEWNGYLEKVKATFLKNSTSTALQWCSHDVSEVYPALKSELFNASFMSVWTNMTEQDQDTVTVMLKHILQNCKHPDPIQTILNLAEFMDHSEKGPFPVDPSVLSKCAKNTKAYAKALRYTEETCRAKGISTEKTSQAMIMYANKLNVDEISRGVVKLAEANNIETSGRWYEKLGEWEKALEMYSEEETKTPHEIKFQSEKAEVAVCKMRCLESLGRWDELRDAGCLLNDPMFKDVDESLSAKAAILTARGCWALGDWEKMQKLVDKVDVTHQDGSFLRAVLAIKHGHYKDALKYIEKVRDMFDSDLTTMASESYERAYGAMVLVQQLSELEEAIEYRVRPDRRSRIAVLWSRRLQGCRQNIEQWHRLLMVRSLVLSLSEMHPLWIKFASLCRRQGKTDLSRRVLRSLLNPNSQIATGEPLNDRAPLKILNMKDSIDRPHLVFAVCKQMWIDGHHVDAYSTLHELRRFMEGSANIKVVTCKDQEISRESSKLVAKCSLKMGEWMLALNSEACRKADPKLAAQPLSPRTDVQAAKLFGEATKFDKKWQKAWQRLATITYNRIMSDRATNSGLVEEFKTIENHMRRMQQSPIPGHQVHHHHHPSQSPIPVTMPITVGPPQLTMSMPPIPHQTPIMHQMPATHPHHMMPIMSAAGPMPAGAIPQPQMPSQGMPQVPMQQVAPLPQGLAQGVPQMQQQMPPQAIQQQPQMVQAPMPAAVMHQGPIPQALSQAQMPQAVPQGAMPPHGIPQPHMAQAPMPAIPQGALPQPQALMQPGPMTQGVLPGVAVPASAIPAQAIIMAPFHSAQSSSGAPVYMSPVMYQGPFPAGLGMPPAEPSDRAKMLIKTAKDTMHYIMRAIELAEGSRLENTLRLFQLVSDFGAINEVNEYLKTAVLNKIPVDTWLEVIPQMMAKLDSEPNVANLFKFIILALGKEHPQSLVYALTVASESSTEKRAKNAKEVMAALRETKQGLFDEAKMVADEFVRCAILWHEQWHEALEEASRLYFHENNAEAMLGKLKPLHEMIRRNNFPTLKEQSFNTTYYNDLKDAEEHCDAYTRSKDPKEMSQAWELYYNVFKRISQQLRQLNSLDLNYISPKLAEARDLELAVPGTYDPSKELVRIASVDAQLNVIMSKQRPRKINIRGSDGNRYAFLLKGHEDPRQDERVMQLFGLINTLLLHESDTCRRNLTIQRYSIIPLSSNSGLIGWVPNSDTIHALIRDYREKNHIALSAEHKQMQEMCNDIETLCLWQKVHVFKTAMAKTKGDDLRKILWMKSPNSETWFDRRTNFTRSMACMSMVGYILGLGDRHPSNLMLDRLSGKIIHIDFGDCFEVAMTREKYPEKIPFRLTRMLVQAMEVTEIEGNYRITCERVLRVMRNNRESLLAVLEAFVYDPLINWRLDTGTKNRADRAAIINTTGGEDIRNSKAENAIARIKDKLTGRDFGESEISIGTQVDRLIFQATNEENLCQCYIGWCPFW
ncbi:hypothetical protein L596_009654 [Steinernema carpocapsae]|uniref:Serine/threonine-protein kinase TOR n=1 Tax=Steinernema carpocapsae TaxID=34508 RepID=A0A4U5PFY7_STECR|nr:hypothetical protein L596_009654 [Steinernema carpocapsae]